MHAVAVPKGVCPLCRPAAPCCPQRLTPSRFRRTKIMEMDKNEALYYNKTQYFPK